MRLGNGCWFSRHIHTVGFVATLTVLLQCFLEFGQPLGNKMDILQRLVVVLKSRTSEAPFIGLDLYLQNNPVAFL